MLQIMAQFKTEVHEDREQWNLKKKFPNKNDQEIQWRKKVKKKKKSEFKYIFLPFFLLMTAL